MARVLDFSMSRRTANGREIHRVYKASYYLDGTMAVFEFIELKLRTHLQVFLPRAHYRNLFDPNGCIILPKDLTKGKELVFDHPDTSCHPHERVSFVITEVDESKVLELRRIVEKKYLPIPHLPSTVEPPQMEKKKVKVRAPPPVIPEPAPIISDEKLALVIDKVRATIRKRGAKDILGLGRHFRILDDSGDDSIDSGEFEKAMRMYGFDLGREELEYLMKHLDKNNDGYVSYDEFLQLVQGEINEFRRNFIKQAFMKMDARRTGQIELQDIKKFYNARSDPRVKSGEMTEDEVLREFLDVFDTITKDGIVSFEEFEEYYKNVSASIDTDAYFELVLRNAWHIPGGEGASANTSNLRVLVEFKDGTSKVICVENDLGLDWKDLEQIHVRLAQQGVAVENIQKISTAM